MTFEEAITIVNTVLDFYPDERLDLHVCSSMQELLDKEADGEALSEEEKSLIENEYNVMYAIVYHPKITITNKYGATHKITDVYTRMTFPHFGLQLARTSFSPEEVASGYVHSHVQKGDFFNMHSFCLGNSSTPVNVISSRIEALLSQPDHSSQEHLDQLSLNVEALLVEVERALKVESKDGGPYIFFSDIVKDKKPQPYFCSTEYAAYEVSSTSKKEKLAELIKYYCSLGLDTFYFDGKSWQLDATDAEFVVRLTNAAKAMKSMRAAKYYNLKYYVNGLFYDTAYTLKNVIQGKHSSWQFKGQLQELHINYTDERQLMPVSVLKNYYISGVYAFLINYINAFYANPSKDNILSRGHKIATSLIRALRG